jgi:hypothetical protein
VTGLERGVGDSKILRADSWYNRYPERTVVRLTGYPVHLIPA